MNKLFIGLLIAAAGAGVFFFLRKRNNSTTGNGIKKDWIIGQWKIDSLSIGKDPDLIYLLYASDSNSKKEIHHFYDNGWMITTQPHDSLSKNDTSYFEWGKNNELLLKDKAADSTGTVFTVVKLTKDSLQVQTKDSAIILLTKLK